MEGKTRIFGECLRVTNVEAMHAAHYRTANTFIIISNTRNIYVPITTAVCHRQLLRWEGMPHFMPDLQGITESRGTASTSAAA